MVFGRFLCSFRSETSFGEGDGKVVNPSLLPVSALKYLHKRVEWSAMPPLCITRRNLTAYAKGGLKAANETKFPEPADDEAIDDSWWVKDRHEATCRLIVHMPLGCSMVLVSIQSRKRFYYNYE